MIKRKLGRKSAHRKNMLKNLAISLFVYEKVKTSTAKAKEVRSLADRAINIAKKDDSLHARRLLLSMFLHNKNAVDKLVNDLAKRFKDEKSGYTRIFKTKSRVGDNSPQSILILSKSKFLNNLKVEEKKDVTKDTKKNTKNK